MTFVTNHRPGLAPLDDTVYNSGYPTNSNNNSLKEIFNV